MSFRLSRLSLALVAALCLAMPALAHDTAKPAAMAVGNIEISGAFSRATLPNAPVGGGFLTITNMGAEDDTLVAASAPIAAETQIHEMAMEGEVMKMRQLKDGIVLPAGESVTLEPGGLHIMFMGLNTALAEGETVPLTLTFARAGTITIDMPVGATAADAPAHAGH